MINNEEKTFETLLDEHLDEMPRKTKEAISKLNLDEKINKIFNKLNIENDMGSKIKGFIWMFALGTISLSDLIDGIPAELRAEQRIYDIFFDYLTIEIIEPISKIFEETTPVETVNKDTREKKVASPEKIIFEKETTQKPETKDINKTADPYLEPIEESDTI